MAAHYEISRDIPDLAYALARPNHAIERNPSDADAYVARGAAYEGGGDFKRALVDYARAIELDKDHIDAHFARGYASLMLRDWFTATADFSKVVAAQPERFHAYYLRAHAYDLWGKRHLALADFSRSIVLAPDHAHALLGRASVHEDMAAWPAGAGRLRRGARHRHADVGALLRARTHLSGTGRHRPLHRRIRAGAAAGADIGRGT